MPKLKKKKNGGYIIHASGDNNPVNTFQVTDQGAEIVLSSGRDLEEFSPTNSSSSCTTSATSPPKE